jgi:hypothetical protein
MERVGVLFATRLRIQLVVGVAEFPADGLTLEDLIDTARASVEPMSTATEPDRRDEPRARRAESSGQRMPVSHRARTSRANSAAALSREVTRSE